MPAPNLDNELTRLRIDKSRKRPRRSGLRWLLILVLLGAAGGGYVLYTQARATIPVKVGRAELASGPAPGSPLLTAGGYIIPRNKIEVSSRVIGRIKDIFVEQGSKVKAGDVLLKIEDQDYQAQVRQAEANLNAAKAKLAELIAGSRPEAIAAVEAAMNAAQATMKNAETDLRRLESLTTDEIISRQALDKARTEYNVAKANLDSARKNYELVKIGPRQEEIDAQRALVRQAEANLEYARTQLDFTVIRAPISGTVLEKLAKQGELVSFQNFGGTRGAKTSVVSMADLSDLQAEIDVNESDMAKVHMGQPCEIRMDSVPDLVLKGKVDEIAPEADRQKGTIQVKVAVANPTEDVRPEVNARVTFQADARPRAEAKAERKVYVPRGALVPAGNETIVYLIEDGTAKARKVKLGDEGPQGVQVLEGLKGNEQVVLEPPARLKDGVRVSEAAS